MSERSLPGIKGLAHVCMGTKNLEQMIQFYTCDLGFEIVHEFINSDEIRYGVFLSCGGRSFIELFNDSKIEINEHSAFRHLCFEVEDLENLSIHLRSKGVSHQMKRGRSDGVLQTFIRDPDGHLIEFQQYDTQCKQWPWVRYKG